MVGGEKTATTLQVRHRTTMRTLTIATFGTKDFLQKYASPLRQDCERLGYQYSQIEVPNSGTIGKINHTILEAMMAYMEWENFDRLCFMDPECRILKPIPDEWIQVRKPVVFLKVRQGNGDPDAKFVHEPDGNVLPCRITGQPMFVGGEDLGWFKSYVNITKAASDADNGEYVRNEMFIDTALDLNGVERINEKIFFVRNDNLPEQKVVKGLWHTPDTVIQHPDIYGYFDSDISDKYGYHPTDHVLPERIFDCHFSAKHCNRVNELMYKEISDISEWPEGSVELSDGRIKLEDWTFDPLTGKLQYSNMQGIRYHHSIKRKAHGHIKTPATKQFVSNNT